MRGTLIIFGVIVLVLLSGGLYLFGNTARPEQQPQFECELSQLRYAAAWEPASGALAGVLSVENDSVKPCRLNGFPTLVLRTESREMATKPFRFDRSFSPLTLGRGMRAEAGFIWRNWCAGEIPTPLFLEVKLPNYNATATTAILDTDGTPTTFVPRCDEAGRSSELSVGPLLEEGAALFSEE